MSANDPISVETLPHAEVQRRMKEQRWTYQPRYSTKERHLYYAGVTRTWVTIEPINAGNWKVSYYATCACGAI